MDIAGESTNKEEQILTPTLQTKWATQDSFKEAKAMFGISCVR